MKSDFVSVPEEPTQPASAWNTPWRKPLPQERRFKLRLEPLTSRSQPRALVESESETSSLHSEVTLLFRYNLKTSSLLFTFYYYLYNIIRVFYLRVSNYQFN